MRDQIRVLHVDDEPSFAEMAAALLEQEDDRFVVETVSSASEGKRRLDGTAFDCVISDYEMPDENGIDFLNAVREEYPELPFILFTGKGSEAVASEAILAGVTEYLQKQAGVEQYELLAHRIKNAVGHHQTARRAETLDRVRTLVADISGALMRASTRKEIETRVCEIISDAEPYRFSWIGSVDEETDLIEPRTSIGIQEGYLEEITVTADGSPTGQGPAGEAIRNGKVAVSQNVQEGPSFEPWREAALDREFQSVAGVPLAYGDTVFGVLAVYADRVNAFDSTERELLSEIGENISYAIDSIRTRHEQEQSNALLSTLMDLLPIGVLAEDADRNVLAINRRLFELFDLPGDPDDVIGQDSQSFSGDVSDRFEDPSAFTRRIDSLVSTWESAEREELQLRDGRTFERSYKPIELVDGSGHLWVYRDTTERVEREAALERRTEELEEMTARLKTQYRYLFEQAPVMAVTTHNQDGEPIIEDCDQLFAETIGYEKSEIVGRPLSAFYTDKSAETLLSGGYERALDGEFMRENRELLTADGDTVETVLRAVPRPDRLEESDGTLALYIDVTERERLKREKARLEEFADIVSHDLRNPLNVANGRLELARMENDNEHLDEIGWAHDRMETLIENLLALARGVQRPDSVESIELSTAAEECWRGVETGDVTFETIGEMYIKADRGRLRQLFENLFRNSVEHGFTGSRPQADDAIEHGFEGSASTPDGADKTVTVGILPDGGGFYVEDNGTGIGSADYKKLFESGYSTAESGIGLGLSIVERIVMAHGWEVAAVESESGGFRVEITDVDTAESGAE